LPVKGKRYASLGQFAFPNGFFVSDSEFLTGRPIDIHLL